MDDMVPHHAVVTGPLNSGVVLIAYVVLIADIFPK